MKFLIEMDEHSLGIIASALKKAPWEMVNDVLVDLQRQVNQQQMAMKKNEEMQSIANPVESPNKTNGLNGTHPEKGV